MCPLSRRYAAAAAIAITFVLLMGGAGPASAATPDPYRVTVVQTSANLSQRLTPMPDLAFGSIRGAAGPMIRVDAAVRYQRVQGFGAAMTDSSAWLIEREISPAQRQALMSALFSTSGIHLNFVKVPIGASDFTHTGVPYTYDDLPAGRSDPTLAHFSIAHDQTDILPALRLARALNPATEFLATPWSPPAWMKTNDALENAGDRGALRPGDYRVWAAYFVAFLRAYARAGIPIGAVTIQNEPGVATLYPGLDFSAAQEGTWVATDLVPALRAAGLHPQIFGADLGWGPTTAYQSAAVTGPGAAHLSGLAWHCYYGSPTVMSRFHQLAPTLDQIVDECSPGISPTPMSEIVISSLRNWASTVALWNLALDPTGGPAQLPNHGCEGCRGLVTINPATGQVSLGLSYYQVGQASAFVQSGARRVASGTFVTYRYPRSGVNVVSPGLDDVALRNPDGSLVLIAYDNAPRPIRFSVVWRGRSFHYDLAPQATATFVWNRP